MNQSNATLIGIIADVFGHHAEINKNCELIDKLYRYSSSSEQKEWQTYLHGFRQYHQKMERAGKEFYQLLTQMPELARDELDHQAGGRIIN